jgi:hypothetical protein
LLAQIVPSVGVVGMEEPFLAYPRLVEAVVGRNVFIEVDGLEVTDCQRPVVVWPLKNTPDARTGIRTVLVERSMAKRILPT